MQVGDAAVPSEVECARILRRLRWGDGRVKCVKCGSRKVNRDGVSGPINKYWCKTCDTYFNDKTKTIFQDSKVGLSKWFAICLLLDEEVSVLQISKTVGLAYRNAYYIAKKLRESPFTPQVLAAIRTPAHRERGEEKAVEPALRMEQL